MQTEVLGLLPAPGKGVDIVFFFATFYLMINKKPRYTPLMPPAGSG